MEYELRVVVELVSVSSQEVVKRDTLKVYDVKAPASILELGLRHEEQISLLGKVQNSINEDASRIRKDNAPINFSVLRRLSLNLLSRDTSVRGSIEMKRYRAGLDDNYLAKIIATV